MGVAYFTQWGSTAEERARSYPCDHYLQGSPPARTLFRAVDIEAPPGLVFGWLSQLRVAPYSYDWLDNGGRVSPRTRDPANEQLAVGQDIMGIFRLAEFEPGRHLTLVLKNGGIFGEVAITYQITPKAGGGSRLCAKIVLRPRFLPLHCLLTVGDLVMMRKQLLTFKALAEAEARTVSKT